MLPPAPAPISFAPNTRSAAARRQALRQEGPAQGDFRADGKVYTGPDYGWQTRESASRIGMGSEALGGYFGSGAPAAPVQNPGSVAPGQRTTAITGNFSGGSRAAVAIQNAAQGAKVGGLGVAAPAPAAPAWGWGDNPAMRDAAMAAGQAAAAARGDTIGDNGMISQRGGGYLGRDQLPATSNPANDAYWARADMNAWANANKALAAQQGWVEGRDYNAASRQLVDPVQSYQVQPPLPEGFNPQAANFQVDPSAPAAPPIGANFGQTALPGAGMGNPAQVPFNPAVTEAVAPPAQDPAARVAPNQMPTTGNSAGELNRSYLEAIKEVSAAPAFEPEVGDDRFNFNPWANPALLSNRLY
jgi:hypothetical protein